LSRAGKARTQQGRGPKPPPRLRRNARGEAQGLLYGGFALDQSDMHLENFHRLSPDRVEDDSLFRFTRALVVATRRWRKIANDRIRPLGQTMMRWETLYLVAYSGAELTQGQLARLLGVEGPTMVRTLHLLAEAGLLERHQSREDLRVTVNRITPRGRQVIGEIMGVTNVLRSEVLSGIDREELAVAHRVMEQVLRNLERAQEAPRIDASETREEGEDG
jgi:MarR family transcriptional regulator for hemolysin